MRRGGIRAYVELSTESRRTAEVMRALLRIHQIETLHTVSGKFDFVALIGRARRRSSISCSTRSGR